MVIIMPNAIDRIAADVRGLGIQPDDTLLVHSSLKSLGWVDGGAEAVIRALIGCLPEGTLLMPALNWEAVTRDSPKFSVLNTPTCVGLITETFRKYPGAVRSMHPTHSVCAYGVNADIITAGHYMDRTPVGAHSPFRLLRKYAGKIMMLGCGLSPNTFMHGVEENANLPYVLEPEPTKIYMEDINGAVHEAYYYMHDFRGIVQRYDRAAECVNVRRGKVLDADVYIMDAAELWDAAGEKLIGDPWFFVDRE